MQRGVSLLLLLLWFFPAEAQQWNGLKKSVLSDRVQKITLTRDSSRAERYSVMFSDLKQAEILLNRHNLNGAIKGSFIPSGVLLVELPITRIAEVFQGTNLVRFVDAWRKPVEETHINGFDRSANKLNLTRAKYPQYNGKGLVVSVKEQAFDTSDIDLRERIVFSGLEAQNSTTHASQMATVIAGGGNSSDISLGAAWAAGVSSSSFETLLPDPVESYTDLKVSVQNHSYGTGIENYYGADAASYDATVRILPYLLHIFSAGNSGDSTSQSGPYAGTKGFANITGSFKMAKNVLTVGGTDSLLQLESRSSRGPAYDGRIKPELVAYGHDGSSGAAAIVSGIALTIQQAYLEKKRSLPPASLTKAILLNTADDLGNPGPDFLTGFGSANALRAIESIDSGWYVTGQAVAGRLNEHNFNVPKDASRLKIMLSWTDPEAEANTPKALVNNLDIIATGPGGSVFQPWILNTSSNSLTEPASTGTDTINNVEQITIEHPAGGLYTIAITNTLSAPSVQDYSITYSYERENHFDWNYPGPFEQLRSGERNLIRWDTDMMESAELSVSTDSGRTWKYIATIADLRDGTYTWYPESGLYSAILKMDIGGKEYPSSSFQVSSLIQPKIVLNCDDSALITWKPLTGIAQYKLFGMRGKYIEPILTTSDTFFNLNKTGSEFFAVAPVIDDTTGERGFTINVNTQGTGCYSNNLLADLQPDGDVIVRFETGTVINVKAITLEKSTGGSFFEIEKEVTPSQLSYEWIDKEVKQGLSYYRVRITLENNQQIVSVVVQVINPGKNDFLFFPNPVRTSQALQVLSANTDDAELYIYDVFGRIIIHKKLLQQIESIRLYQPGIYFYQVQVASKRVKSGKLVVN